MKTRKTHALTFGCSYSVIKERRYDTLPFGRRCLRALQGAWSKTSVSHIASALAKLANMPSPLQDVMPLAAGSLPYHCCGSCQTDRRHALDTERFPGTEKLHCSARASA